MSDYLSAMAAIPDFDFNIRLNAPPYATSTGINPVIYGNPVSSPGIVPNDADTAVKFNGSNALLHYTLPDPSLYSDMPNKGWTISFPVQRTAANLTSNLLLMDFADDINWYGQYTSVGVYWYGSTLYCTSNSHGYTSIYSGTPLNTNTHTITLAHNNSPTLSGMRLKLYFDGVLAGSLQAPGGGSNALSKYLRLGTAFDMFFGTSFIMGPVSGFKRELTQQEITGIVTEVNKPGAPVITIPPTATSAEVMQIVKDLGIIPSNANRTMAASIIATYLALGKAYNSNETKSALLNALKN